MPLMPLNAFTMDSLSFARQEGKNTRRTPRMLQCGDGLGGERETDRQKLRSKKEQRVFCCALLRSSRLVPKGEREIEGRGQVLEPRALAKDLGSGGETPDAGAGPLQVDSEQCPRRSVSLALSRNAPAVREVRQRQSVESTVRNQPAARHMRARRECETRLPGR